MTTDTWRRSRVRRPLRTVSRPILNMISLLGHLVIAFGLVIALGGAVASFIGGYQRRTEVARWGARAAYVGFGSVARAVLLIEFALIRDGFSGMYLDDFRV